MTPDDDRRARFEALVEQIHDPLVRYLRRRASADDADDVMGDVLLILWRRFDDIPNPVPLPWCYGVARRALSNHRRGLRRKLHLIERLEAQPPQSYDPGGAEDYPELTAALATLSPADREIVALWAWEDLEPRQIAVVLETTPNAVSLRLSRARKKLAAEISRQNPSRAGHIQDGHTGANE
jgi:RNA polymerase sigma-70 factor (ECF subfamily)